jgi:transcriptional regulator with GAF, ATPase, and Fis domain
MVQFLMFLFMLILGITLYVSFRNDRGDLFKTLTVLGIIVCLYINKERGLKRQRERLVDEVAEKGHQVDSLKKEISANKVEVMQLEYRLQELTDLYRAINTVNAVTQHDETCDAVLQAALDLVGGDRGSLMLIDSPNRTLVFASAVGLEDSVLKGPALRIGDGIAGWVAKNAEPVLLTGDLYEDTRFESIGKQIGEMNVAMSVPLRLGDQVIGVLNLGSSVNAGKQRFSKDEQRFAYLFAEHAAIAVDRAEMFERTLRFTSENGTGDQELAKTSASVRARTIDN